MDLQQIRCFLVLAETLNFTRAAERCGISQPALSRNVQRLEEELGGPLILRERALTQLTSLGQEMLPLLRRTYEAAEAARGRAAQRRRAMDPVPVRLGLCPFVSLGPFLPALAELRDGVPALDLSLVRLPESGLVEGLLHGELDLALLPDFGGLPDRVNRAIVLAAEPKVLVQAGGPLDDGEDCIRVERLRDAPMLAPAAPSMLAACEKGRAALGLRGPLVHGGSGPEEVGALVALGLGFAWVGENAAAPPGTALRTVVSDPPALVEIVVLSVAGRPMNHGVRLLHRHLRGMAGTEGGRSTYPAASASGGGTSV